MSRLDELIQELCPNGVEYKKLGDAVSIERGKRLVRDQLSADSGSGYPVFQNSMTPLGYHTDYNYPENTAFIIGAGAAGEIGFSAVKF
jgi:type I restriction enzyme, S subunit